MPFSESTHPKDLRVSYPFKLRSARLIAAPLKPGSLHSYVNNLSDWEQEVGFEPSGSKHNPEMEARFNLLLSLQGNWSAYEFIWQTLWVLIDPNRSKVIGEFCFQKFDAISPWLELGYSIRKEERGKGYMTEALSCLKQWEPASASNKGLVARTQIGNLASKKVLEKSEFQLHSTSADEELWVYEFPTRINASRSSEQVMK